MGSNSIFNDLEESFAAHPDALQAIQELNGARIFITGGTGFFGCWLLESLSWFYFNLKIHFQVTVLTRNPQNFQKNWPKLAQLPFVTLIPGDILQLRQLDSNKDVFAYSYTHFIHAATEASAKLNTENPLVMFDTAYEGTRQALDFAVKKGVKRFLLTSSGAVYGKQPAELPHVPEDYRGGPNPLELHSAYGEAKRSAEFLCAAYSQFRNIDATIARCFAFVGPYLPLDIHYAIGNFIRDGMSGRTIRVTGDGTAFRSYLYGADLTVWLWTILLRGTPARAYNVGSEDFLSLGELAKKINQSFSFQAPVKIEGTPIPGKLPDRYVPSTQRAQKELGLRQTSDLASALKKTYQWFEARQLKSSEG